MVMPFALFCFLIFSYIHQQMVLVHLSGSNKLLWMVGVCGCIFLCCSELSRSNVPIALVVVSLSFSCCCNFSPLSLNRRTHTSMVVDDVRGQWIAFDSQGQIQNFMLISILVLVFLSDWLKFPQSLTKFWGFLKYFDAPFSAKRVCKAQSAPV